MVTYVDLRDDAALLSLEHQLHLYDLLGLVAWSTDLVAGRFELSNEDTTMTCTDMQFLGTAAPGPKSWLWAWASPDDYPPAIHEAAQQARAFGERHGIPELSTGEVPFASLPGAPTDPVVVASHMMEVSKAVTGRFTGYQGSFGRGTRAGFLLGHPDLVLPEPTGTRVTRVLQQGLTELTFHNQRRGVDSYARRRAGLDVSHDGQHTTVLGPGFKIELRFDEQNLFTLMSAHLGDAVMPPQIYEPGDQPPM